MLGIFSVIRSWIQTHQFVFEELDVRHGMAEGRNCCSWACGIIVVEVNPLNQFFGLNNRRWPRILNIIVFSRSLSFKKVPSRNRLLN